MRHLANTGARMLVQLIVLGILLSLPAAAADTMSCGVSTKAGVTCSCDVRTLRPLQGAIGWRRCVRILRADVGGVKKEFDGAPVVEIKMEIILRMHSTHRRGDVLGREAPP